MLPYKLGSIEASEVLIKDLYIDLRAKVNAWAEITCQTPQARMGYIGQHLTSVVTGYPGGKSGARGYDIVLPDDKYGEIKTCYRVDQLGSCMDCGAPVSSLEMYCSSCKSTNINRKDDSKWLISIKNDTEFAKIIDPYRYYFVLFEFEEIENLKNSNIVASIWEVDPKAKGFGYCMIDYYLNIRSKSSSKAPFDMWPHDFKFTLTMPKLIYQSLICEDGKIITKIFPNNGLERIDELKPLLNYSRAKTLTVASLKKTIHKFAPDICTAQKSKTALINILEDLRLTDHISNDNLCDALADAIYLPKIIPVKKSIPPQIRLIYPELS